MSWITDTWLKPSEFDLYIQITGVDGYEVKIENSVEFYLSRLLGDELYALFFSDFEDELDTAIYVNLRDGILFEKSDGNVWKFKGLKDMCLLFVLSDLNSKYWNNSEVGAVRDTASNDSLFSINAQKQVSCEYYQKALSLYYAAISYLDEKKEDFPAWKLSLLNPRNVINY